MAKSSSAKQDPAPAPVEGRSRVELVGRIKREAQKPDKQGDRTPFAFLTVETEVLIDEESGKVETVFHDVVGFDGVAMHLAKKFDEGDPVRVRGRLQYRTGKTEADGRTHRIVVEAEDDIATAEADTPHMVAVEVVGVISDAKGGEAKKSKIPFFRAKVTAEVPYTVGDGTSVIEHDLLGFDRAAVAAGDLGLQDGDSVLAKGRLTRTPRNRKAEPLIWEPRVVFDDISGGIERAV